MDQTRKALTAFYSLYCLVVISLVVLAFQAYYAMPSTWGLVLLYFVGVNFIAALIWLFRMGLECIRYKQRGLEGPAEIQIVPEKTASENVDMFDYVNNQDQEMILKELGLWFVDSLRLMKNSPNLFKTEDLLAPIPARIAKKFWSWLLNKYTRWAFHVCILGTIAFLSYSILGLMPLGILFVFCWAISVFLFALGLMKTL